MSRIRFSSADMRERFNTVFAQTGNDIKSMPGFVHQSWWYHPRDDLLQVQVSFWQSEADLQRWLGHSYHHEARQWAARAGAVIEVIVTDFELKNTLLIRLCPTCGDLSEVPYDVAQERDTLAAPCHVCGYRYPMIADEPDHSMVWGNQAAQPA